MDRKEFFSHALKLVIGKGLQVLESNKVVQKLENLAEDEKDPIPKKQRPPGAFYTEREFLQRCTGCDACMAACPANVIMIEDLDRRDPLIYPDEGPCIQCPGYPCITACTPGALDKTNGIKLRAFEVANGS